MLVGLGRPRTNEALTISGMRSRTLGTSRKGRPLLTIRGGSNLPLRISQISSLSQSRTTRSKNLRQSWGNALACGPPMTVRTPSRRYSLASA
jgi:hypothetical protein